MHPSISALIDELTAPQHREAYNALNTQERNEYHAHVYDGALQAYAELRISKIHNGLEKTGWKLERHIEPILPEEGNHQIPERVKRVIYLKLKSFQRLIVGFSDVWIMFEWRWSQLWTSMPIASYTGVMGFT
jgi:hypothetical protein